MSGNQFDDDEPGEGGDSGAAAEDAVGEADVRTAEAPGDGGDRSDGRRHETADRSVAVPAVDDVDLSDPEYYRNRELSELEFQKRVLYEAIDGRNPLLERVKFLSIFTTNMDEFFRKRVGGLKQQIAAGVTERTPDGRTPREQWEEIHEVARPMFERQTACYREEIRPALADAGIRILDYDDVSADERADLREYFESSVLPTLTPLTFDPAHPFPHISNLSLSLGVLSREEADDDLTFSRVKVPQNRPRLVRVGGGEQGVREVEESASASDRDARVVLLEDVIGDNLDLLFPNVEIVDYSTFRVTRNAEVGR